MNKFIRQLRNIPFGKINEYLRSNPVEKKLLGRWGVDHDIQAEIKADYTNEDHCGVCNSLRENFIKKREENIEQSKIKKYNEINEDYKTPFLM